jgi:hypothetical protein
MPKQINLSTKNGSLGPEADYKDPKLQKIKGVMKGRPPGKFFAK